MPPRDFCCSPQHSTWGHSDDSFIPRVAKEIEIRICGVNKDGRHNSRGRKICVSCRYRIKLEKKCEQLQVRLSVHFFPGFLHSQILVVLGHQNSLFVFHL